MMLLVHLVKVTHHTVVKAKFPHEVLETKVKVDIEQFGIVPVNNLNYLFVSLVIEVWEEVRSEAYGEVVPNLAMLAQIDEEVNDEDHFLFVQLCSLLD